MRLFYNLSVRLSSVGINIASLWNEKARLWVNGRKNLHIPEGLEGCIWFHCASLGEFEQAKPLIESIKSDQSDKAIAVSFYSPSGFEQRKNYELADLVFYLPLDTKSNAKKIVSALSPSMVFFVKYELWYHYIQAIKSTESKLFLLSASFRPNHRYFRWYGGFFKNMLKQMDMIFVQDDRSIRLLDAAGISNKIITGDTRFDQVLELPQTEFKDDVIESFCETNTKVLVVGSSWTKEESILRETLPILDDEWLVILAPHDVSEHHIKEIQSNFSSELIKYSDYKHKPIKTTARVLLIDSVGILSRLYRYGTAAYVGGGYSGNLHNILEPASYGIPICFGPNHAKFHEAGDMIKNGDAQEIRNSDDLIRFLNNLPATATLKNKEFIITRSGATNKVQQYLRK